MQEQQNQNKLCKCEPNDNMSAAIGAGLGIIFGGAFDNPGAGLVLGAALGLFVGSIMCGKR